MFGKIRRAHKKEMAECKKENEISRRVRESICESKEKERLQQTARMEHKVEEYKSKHTIGTKFDYLELKMILTDIWIGNDNNIWAVASHIRDGQIVEERIPIELFESLAK